MYRRYESCGRYRSPIRAGDPIDLEILYVP